MKKEGIGMSSYEYYDLFLKAQVSGKYHMFVFDIVNSKGMTAEMRWVAQEKMIQLMKKIYGTIQKLEVKKDKKILVNDDGIVSYEESLKVANKFGMLMEPFVFGDTFGFTIYKDSISKDVIMNLYNRYNEELKIDFEFHVIDGFYETNKWEEGNRLFFRGYCMDILSQYHKDCYRKIRNVGKNNFKRYND